MIYYAKCQKCGGQVLYNLGEFSCIQCGAEHDKYGRWLKARKARGLDPDGYHGYKFQGVSASWKN